MSPGVALVISGLAALLATWLLLFPLRRWLTARQIVDVPNERTSHQGTRARGGGLAIVLVTLIGLVIAQAIAGTLGQPVFWGYAVGALIIAGTQVDDVGTLSSAARLAAHLTAAIVLVATAGYFQDVNLPVIGPLHIGLLGLPLTLFWLVGLTNAYNFMDGIDGLALGSEAVVAGLGWAMLGAVISLPLVGALGALVAGVSRFLGAQLAASEGLHGRRRQRFSGLHPRVNDHHRGAVQPSALVFGLLLVWPFVFDSGLTFLRRLSRGENVFAAHRSHLYQRLSKTPGGWSHRSTTGLDICLTLAGLGLAARWMNAMWGGVLAVVVVLLMASGLTLGVRRLANRSGMV